MAKGKSATKAPSAKQKQVLDGLRARKPITDIAEEMGITVQAVYGHMARMRAKKIRLPRPRPAHTATMAPAEASEASVNGSANGRVEDVPAQVKAAVKAIDDAIAAEADIQSDAGSEIRDVEEKINVLQGRLSDLRHGAEASLGRTDGLRAAREQMPA